MKQKLPEEIEGQLLTADAESMTLDLQTLPEAEQTELATALLNCVREEAVPFATDFDRQKHDTSTRLKVSVVAHELGHCVGYHMAIADPELQAKEAYTIALRGEDKPDRRAMLACCSSYSSFCGAQHWIGTVGGMLCGAGYLGEIIGDTQHWQEADAAGLLALSCKASCTSYEDLRNAFLQRPVDFDYTKPLLQYFWQAGINMANDPDLYERLLMLDGVVRSRGEVSLDAQGLACFVPSTGKKE